VSTTSGNDFIKLRIAEAYIKLLCIPEDAQGARMVSLEWIGNREIRMFEATQPSPDNMPLFWMELFDHDRQSSVDACICYEIEAAVAAFEDFVAQTKSANESPSRDGNETQD
jgi:hypothetical protein